jgi:galactonate dehydratase
VTKIDTIDTYSRWADWCNWMFVRVRTDDGVEAWGEGSLHGSVQSVCTAIDELKPILVGKPFEGPTVAWHHLYHAWRWRGGSVLNTALSALDTALWDLEAQLRDVPLYRLLGGPLRQTVPAYSSHWCYQGTTPEDAFTAAKATVAQGYRAFKWSLPRVWDNRDVPGSIARAVDFLAAAREAVGPDISIFIDCAECLVMWSLEKLADNIRTLNIGWLEEPLRFENSRSFAGLSHLVGIPIATGERLLNRWEYRELLDVGGCEFVQPDVMHAGGPTELKKIADLAQLYSVTVCPHNSGGPVATTASVHLALTIPNFGLLETMDAESTLRAQTASGGASCENGLFPMPQGNGLGVKIDCEAMARSPARPQPPSEAPVLWTR